MEGRAAGNPWEAFWFCRILAATRAAGGVAVSGGEWLPVEVVLWIRTFPLIEAGWGEDWVRPDAGGI